MHFFGFPIIFVSLGTLLIISLSKHIPSVYVTWYIYSLHQVSQQLLCRSKEGLPALRDYQLTWSPCVLSCAFDFREIVWGFSCPFCIEIVILRNHADLKTMSKRVESEQYYVTFEMFVADVRRMFANARSYNSPETIYYKCASRHGASTPHIPFIPPLFFFSQRSFNSCVHRKKKSS